MTMESNFDSKVVLVTGAGRGIGRAIATRLHLYGAIVYGLDTNRENLDSLVKECPSLKPLNINLCDWSATRSVVKGIGAIDYVVNCAGVVPKATPFLDVKRSVFDDVFSVNLMAPINIGQIAGKVMKKSGKGGAIVNISSVNSKLTATNIAPYSISKAALDMVTKCMASELGPTVRVNAVNPSIILTDMSRAAMEDSNIGMAWFEAFKDRHPLWRFGEINEVVEAVIFLLSEKASYITGHCLPVEGGLFCRLYI